MRPDALNRVLVHVQAHLDADLSLGALARVAGFSRFHFEREFTRDTGETVKQYTQRLRLERAAIRLLLHRGSILDVALESGFQSHETFSRAFRRRFGVAPRQYRQRGSFEGDRVRRPRIRLIEAPFEISATRVVELGPIHVAFLRHVGPYENVGEGLWEELAAWARRRRVPEPHVFLGIGHDAPGVTPPERLRFDAALRVPAPFAPRGRIGYQVVGGGPHAVTTHVGAYATLPDAYARVFPRVVELRGYRVVGLPCIEVYQTTVMRVRFAFNHTEICIPVEKRTRAAT